MQRIATAIGLVLLALAGCGPAQDTKPTHAKAPATPQVETKTPPKVAKLEPYTCGTVQRLHTLDGIFAGSQPAADDLRHAKENGIKTILNLRPTSEDAGFDEAALVAQLGLTYELIPFATPAELTDDVFERARAVLRDTTKRPVFFHCNSGNRVGAIWAAYRVLDGGQTWDAALEEAKQVGLKTPAFEQRAKEYVEKMRAKT
jgi:uncharacterized protein (TIGR01244 family)